MLPRFDRAGEGTNPARVRERRGEPSLVAADAGWWIASYVAGSLPMGLMVGKLRGVDLRKAGSGNIGATNAGRVLGKPFFQVVFALDFLKSFVPTLLALRRAPVPGGVDAPLLALGCGVAAVVGHVFPVFLRFRGGKGVATASGVFFALAWAPALCALAAWIVVYKTTRWVSLASLAAAVVLPLACWLLPKLVPVVVAQEIRWAALVVGALILVRHKSNIGRLLRGEEPRSGVPQSR
jgi:glycerol-3-phosphate acyltransferase PlsY